MFNVSIFFKKPIEPAVNVDINLIGKTIYQRLSKAYSLTEISSTYKK